MLRTTATSILRALGVVLGIILVTVVTWIGLNWSKARLDDYTHMQDLTRGLVTIVNYNLSQGKLALPPAPPAPQPPPDTK